MAEPQLKTTLQRKCAETEALIADYRRRTDLAQTDLIHLNATIAMFERETRRDDPRRPMSLTKVFQRGELFTICELAMKRNPTGLDTGELADLCIKTKGLDETDKTIRSGVRMQICVIMQKRRERGLIVSTEKRGLLRVWRLP